MIVNLNSYFGSEFERRATFRSVEAGRNIAHDAYIIMRLYLQNMDNQLSTFTISVRYLN